MIDLIHKMKVITLKKWWQKSIIALVAVVTLGAISPNHEIWETLRDDKDQPKSYAEEERQQVVYDLVDPSEVYYQDRFILENVRKTAEEQAYLKFGSRIGPVIQDEFDSVIMPNIQRAIDLHLGELPAESLNRLAISEKPAGDYSEKIFHIYDSETNKDAIRFHVRTEKKPQEGFFFNFHYHLAEDDFQRHIELGDIYWSKNTPPKWLS